MTRLDATFARDFVDLAVRNNVARRTDIKSLTIGHVTGETVTLRTPREGSWPAGIGGDNSRNAVSSAKRAGVIGTQSARVLYRGALCCRCR
jgi:hypothetical protein